MSRWFRFYDDALHDPKVQMLPPVLFKAAFMAAINGQSSEFSPFLKRGRDRPSGPEWQKLRDATFARDDYTCQYCGTRGVKLECDHVIPVSRGGISALENLKTACFPCNRSKRDKLLSEWLQ